MHRSAKENVFTAVIHFTSPLLLVVSLLFSDEGFQWDPFDPYVREAYPLSPAASPFLCGVMCHMSWRVSFLTRHTEVSFSARTSKEKKERGKRAKERSRKHSSLSPAV